MFEFSARGKKKDENFMWKTWIVEGRVEIKDGDEATSRKKAENV
jgi:hypothetical protein